MTTFTNVVRRTTGVFRNKINMINEISELNQPSVKRQKDKLMEFIKEKAERALESEFARKIKTAKGYYTLEMAPPNSNELQKLKSDIVLVKEFFGSGCHKYLTVKQAFLLLLVGTEIGMWFFLGETIGKMHIVGYKV